MISSNDSKGKVFKPKNSIFFMAGKENSFLKAASLASEIGQEKEVKKNKLGVAESKGSKKKIKKTLKKSPVKKNSSNIIITKTVEEKTLAPSVCEQEEISGNLAVTEESLPFEETLNHPKGGFIEVFGGLTMVLIVCELIILLIIIVLAFLA